MQAVPMTTPRVVSVAFSLLALRALKAACQVSESITVVGSSTTATVQPPKGIAGCIPIRVEGKCGTVFLGSGRHVSCTLVQTTKPFMRRRVGRQIAAARGGGQIRAEEPFSVGQIPIREHECDSLVVRKSGIARLYSGGLLDHTGKFRCIATRLVKVRRFQVG